MCNNSDHARFLNVFSAENSCLACELEKTEKARKELENQLVWLADWCRVVLRVEPNERIGKGGCNCLVETVARVMEERVGLRYV